MALLDIKNLTLEIPREDSYIKVLDKINVSVSEGEVRALVENQAPEKV
jgi:ABC-type antimicrobial peptide transport system ATPase subunit